MDAACFGLPLLVAEEAQITPPTLGFQNTAIFLYPLHRCTHGSSLAGWANSSDSTNSIAMCIASKYTTEPD